MRAPVFKQLTILASVVVLGLVLGGCSKCDIFKNDHRTSLQTCK